MNLSQAKPELWHSLGEASSKCRHLVDIPLKPDTAEILNQIFLAKGALATTAIEGNTLSEDEVRRHFAGELKLPPSREYLTKEIDNIVAAFNSIDKKLLNGESIKLNSELISFFNKTILDGLILDDPETVPGEIGKLPVIVASYRGAPREDCKYLLEKLCTWLNGKDFMPPREEYKITYGLLKAIYAHVYFVWIHPYDDGNGRTARLIESTILLEAGVPSTATHLLSNHYNLTRNVYYQKLDEVSRNGGNLIPFINYAVTGYIEQLREHITIVKLQQIKVAWINYIHDIFRNKHKQADIRRRKLIIAITDNQISEVKLEDIKNLNNEMAVQYARSADITIRKDLESLEKLGLLEENENGYRAKIEKMMAFTPVTNERVDKELSEALADVSRQFDLFD